MPIVARLHLNGDLEIKGSLYTQWDSYDDTSNIDDIRQLDDTYQLDDNAELSTLFNYLFGLTETKTTVTVAMIDNKGNLITPSVNQSSSVKFAIKNNKQIDIGGVLTQNAPI